jgi:hypothetical protein
VQNGCRFSDLVRLLAVAGAVGAVSGAALANDPGRTPPDQKIVKTPSVVSPSVGVTPVAPGKVEFPAKDGMTPTKPLVQQGPFLRGPGPANDDCINAELIAVPGTAFGDTTAATADPDDAICSASGCAGQPGVWYTFFGNGNSFQITTCSGATFDTMLRVYTGTCGALTCVGYNDDACGVQSTVNVPTVNGQQYWVLVRGYCANGSFTLDVIDLGGPPANDECDGAIMLTCNSVTVADNTLATINPADPFISCHFGGPQQGDGSIWYKFVATDTSARIQTCGSFAPADDSIIAVYDDCNGFEIGCSEDFCGLLSRVDLQGLTIGNTYTIMLASYDVSDQGMYTLELVCPVPAAAPGDECSSALPIASLPFSTSGDTSMFEPDAGLPACGAGAAAPSVWYSVVGTGNTFLATLCNGTSYDSALAVFAGDCGALTCVANNDDFCGLQSQVTFPTFAGETYYIVVRGFSANAGFYTLDVSELLPPPNDECENAIAIGCNETVIIDNLAATTNPFDPFFSCHASGLPSQGYGTMWYSFTAGDTSARFVTCGNVTPADDTLLALYDGCNGIELACNDDYCGFLSRLDVHGLTIGNTYVLQFAAWSASDQATYIMDVICPVPPIPPGDECPTALAIESLPFSTSGDTSMFEPDGGLPACGVGAAAPSVWYSMVGTGGVIEVSLCNGTSYDSALALFTGDCGALTCLGSDDDGCGIFAGPSRMLFVSNPGQIYYIVVRGYGTSFGFYTLDVTDLGPPAEGDFCTTAIPADVPSSVSGDTSLYTPDGGIPACGVLANAPTVWYSVVGNGNRYRASMCAGTVYDGALAVYTGFDCGALTCVASDDDGCGIFAGPSEVTWDTVDGQTYYVVVGGYGTSAGFYTLDLIDIGPPCELDVPPGADMENEFDCGLPFDAVNGGCNSSPAMFGTVQCGVPLFGSTAWDPSIGLRDTDWYLFELTSDDTVTITVRSEAVTIFGFVGDAVGPIPYSDPSWCNFITQVNPYIVGTDDCGDNVLSTFLTAGTYVVFVSTLFADNPVLCGFRNDYVLTVETSSCQGAVDCNGNGIPDSVEIAADPALDCYNPAVIQNPNVIGGPDGALDSCQCQGNFNRDGAVNSTDISAMLAGWLDAVNNGNTNADINCSGSTNSTDISAFLTIWLAQVQGDDPNDGCP